MDRTTSQTATQYALRHAHGSYQEGIVTGSQRLSGSDLRGKASRWGARYNASKGELLRRLHSDPLLYVGEHTEAHGLRVLDILWDV